MGQIAFYCPGVHNLSAFLSDRAKLDVVTRWSDAEFFLELNPSTR